MSTMNISLPDALKSFVDARVASGGFGSHSEYVRALVRRDEAEAAKEAVRSLVAQGLASPVAAKPWGTLRDELRSRTA